MVTFENPLLFSTSVMHFLTCYISFDNLVLQQEYNSPGPPGWGLGAGLTTLPSKKVHVTETGNIDDATQTGGAAAGAIMTPLGQSWREAQKPIGPIVAPKKQTTIGCWHVRTMAEATQTAQVAKEMAGYGIEVLGISESRWKGMGSTTLQLFYGIGVDTGRPESERETKDLLEKDCGKREKHGRVE